MDEPTPANSAAAPVPEAHDLPNAQTAPVPERKPGKLVSALHGLTPEEIKIVEEVSK